MRRSGASASAASSWRCDSSDYKNERTTSIWEASTYTGEKEQIETLTDQIAGEEKQVAKLTEQIAELENEHEAMQQEIARLGWHLGRSEGRVEKAEEGQQQLGHELRLAEARAGADARDGRGRQIGRASCRERV